MSTDDRLTMALYRQEQEDKRKPRVIRTYGLLTKGIRVPCLFDSRQAAEENRDPDERIVEVRVEILREVKPRPRT